MAVAVHLPKVGMTMEEGILARWLAPDGSPVVRGQPIFELETEKVTQEVEAEQAGTLKHLVAEGWTVEPGAVVGCLLEDGESTVPDELIGSVAEQAMRPPDGAPAPAAPAPAPPEAPPSTPAPPGERVIASPAARRLAAQHGLDLADVAATGPRGRIQERDVRAAIEAPAAAAAAPPGAAVPADDAVHPPVPYRGRRRTIGERMHESLRSMAQLTLSGEVDVESAMQQLHGLNREWRGERTVVTFTMLVVKAAALALREHPRLNARLDGDQIVVEPEVNVSSPAAWRPSPTGCRTARSPSTTSPAAPSP
jgi:pyruvate dehydrogenase E2 component (dihydrolipoamide acetyltransferase)